MSYTTIYTKKKKDPILKTPYTHGCAYTTKTLTPHHAFLRSKFPDAQTWESPDRVCTNFAGSMNLRGLPIVVGGTRLA